MPPPPRSSTRTMMMSRVLVSMLVPLEVAGGSTSANGHATRQANCTIWAERRLRNLFLAGVLPSAAGEGSPAERRRERVGADPAGARLRARRAVRRAFDPLPDRGARTGPWI